MCIDHLDLFIFHFQGFVTREFIASGGLLVIGQSVMAAPNNRLEDDKIHKIWTERLNMLFNFFTDKGILQSVCLIIFFFHIFLSHRGLL